MRMRGNRSVQIGGLRILWRGKDISNLYIYGCDPIGCLSPGYGVFV